jgi:hypothetical protein
MSGGKSKAELAKDAREINRIHGQIVENAQTNLQLAIECGTILLDDKKSVSHGEWEEYVKTNFPEIAAETVRLYMRLAKNAADLERLAAQNGNTVADLSIRGALRLLAPVKSDEQKAKAQAERERKAAENEQAAKLAAAAGANLTDVMNAKGVEEIKTALKQSERFDEVARVMTPPLGQQLKAANPFELALLLTDTAVWPVEKVRALIDELNKRMKSAAEERVKSAEPSTFRPRPVQPEARQ